MFRNRIVRVDNRSIQLILLLVLAYASFASQTDSGEAQSASTLHEELSSILDEQANAWNRGDIDEFMSAYWQSNGLTFSSGGVTQRGWKATRDRYHKKYPNAEKMGKLTFTELETQQLGENHALMLGRWTLRRSDPAQGNFSLVWKKLNDEWTIIHDHSSLQEQAEAP